MKKMINLLCVKPTRLIRINMFLPSSVKSIPQSPQSLLQLATKLLQSINYLGKLYHFDFCNNRNSILLITKGCQHILCNIFISETQMSYTRQRHPATRLGEDLQPVIFHHVDPPNPKYNPLLIKSGGCLSKARRFP